MLQSTSDRGEYNPVKYLAHPAVNSCSVSHPGSRETGHCQRLDFDLPFFREMKNT